MVFGIITKKSGSKGSGSKLYHKLKSIEDFSFFINKGNIRYSVNSNSDRSIPVQSSYNKRFSEQSYNTAADISMTDSCYSIASTSTASTEYSYDRNKNISDSFENVNMNNESQRKKKHRKRRTLSKLLGTFSFNDKLIQSMQCPDWEYYCTNKNLYKYDIY